MKAFTDTPITKERFIHHLKWHQEQDAFLKGTYSDQDSDEFKGCAVGCSIYSIEKELGNESLDYEDHSLYEKYLGIPEWLARVEDTLFEGLPIERSKVWPVEFGEAINVGADLDKIKPAFFIFILELTLQYVEKPEFKQQKDSVLRVIRLWKREDIYSISWEKERDAARAAAGNAGAAAGNAAGAARNAAWNAAGNARAAAGNAGAAAGAAGAARNAAWNAAGNAGAAAWNAAGAARAAAGNAGAAAGNAAGAAAHVKFADKLLELIRSCK